MNVDDIATMSADPEIVKHRLSHLLQIHPDAAEEMERMALLHGMLAGSEYLVNWLASRHGELGWLLGEGILDMPRSQKEMEENLAGLMALHPTPKAMRYFKHRELARICARELSGAAKLGDTLSEWTQVAETAIHCAATWAMEEARKRYGDPVYTGIDDSEQKLAGFAVIGMGKLGGGELNISSDVDVIYVHTSDRGTTSGPKKVHLHEFFTHVALSTNKLLNDVTEDGFVFRMDLDLRPEGPSGEITNSIGAMETYYESYGRQWERQALIKARHCGGDPAVTEEIMHRLQPFIYRKYMDETALKEIADIKNKIDRSLTTRKSAKSSADDIKLGRGGIREIEFTVQALQLLYGGRNKTLQTRSTLKALAACQAMGLVSMPHYADLRESYIFLRRMENRIQYDGNLQTHIIPANLEKQAALARLMGFAGEDAGEKMMEETSRRRKRVREIFDLFTLEKESEAERFPAPLEDEGAIIHWLDSLRFDHPTASARALLLLRDGPAFSHPSEKSQRAFDRFGPELVAKAAASAWPDQVILGFSNYVEAKKGRDQLYSLLDNHRPVIQLLSSVFSSSESLTASLIRQPDIIERLLAADPVGLPADAAGYNAEFSRIMRVTPAKGRLALFNSFKVAENLRLGLRRILGLAEREELMKGLTWLAEEYLAAVIRTAEESLPPRPQGAMWALVAAGKMGRREMNFGSDMDLIALFDYTGALAERENAREWVGMLIQKVIKLCGELTSYGYGYQMDMRLRPEGVSAPLVVSLAAAKDYYSGRAGVWERLALVGARPLAGDIKLRERVDDLLRKFVESPSPQDVGLIVAMRDKMTKEKVKRGVVDIKFGQGGLVDVEFICQWLRIDKRFRQEAPEPFTITLLREAKRRKWIDTQMSQTLIRGYGLLRAVEDTVRMNREQALHTIPEWDTALIKRLSRTVETEAGPEKFLDYVKEVMAQVREVFDQFFSSERPVA
ncbi:MAG: bifunctional [glutamate--ammonia ligase]-adenylyl-L-tyrosine phosphorylase/[glutamate--ammonia-ligase] adenylyltransferase [Nitrospinota bacterium]|nr:bifunctional [glutamate--ammonia ligase]-adenylyl-L-tyrosine phosphorylase/[glutamate--ammonia-ligase] adenylyltransferase [Nitrospinota bacterium]